MMHEEPHLTACGILKLNLSLINPVTFAFSYCYTSANTLNLLQILHALTTYLVILIQFDTAENSHKFSNNNLGDQQG